MSLFLIFAALTVSVLIPLLRPLMRGVAASPPRADFDLAIYKDQLAELDRDQARGTLSAAEANAARLEIQRRLLAAMPVDGAADQAAPPRRPMPAVGLSLLVLVPLSAIGLYAWLGRPNLPDAPFAARAIERPLLAQDGTLDLSKVQAALKQRLASDPDSLDGWVFLARTDGNLQDWPGAIDAWHHARTLSHDRPDVLSGLAEALVAQSGGLVTDEAATLFGRVLQAQPQSAQPRYYLALAKAQQGDLPGAIAAWSALLRDAPGDAAWRPQVEKLIAQAAEAPPIAGPTAPPAGEQAAIMALPPEQRSQAIQGMVEGLALKLQAKPDDAEGWRRLARAYLVLGQTDKAADAYHHLLLLRPDDADALWQSGQAAAKAGDAASARGYWRHLLAKLGPRDPTRATIERALAQL